MSFDSTKNTLEKLLEQVDEGSLQLPEFQRDYVWAEEAVVSLLASIAKGYPVGALLLLERGGEVDFQPRLVEGVKLDKPIEPDLLLLDGQQRMTSLYQVLWSARPALLKNAKNQKVERHLFLNVDKAVAAGVSFEDAIEIMPGDKRRMKDFGREIDLDLSTPELQYAAHMVPLDRVFDEDDWLFGWRDHWREREVDTRDTEKLFKQTVIKRIQKYEMPIIRLLKETHLTQKERVAEFEKGGFGDRATFFRRLKKQRSLTAQAIPERVIVQKKSVVLPVQPVRTSSGGADTMSLVLK